jgi:hypothetical protein
MGDLINTPITLSMASSTGWPAAARKPAKRRTRMRGRSEPGPQDRLVKVPVPLPLRTSAPCRVTRCPRIRELVRDPRNCGAGASTQPVDNSVDSVGSDRRVAGEIRLASLWITPRAIADGPSQLPERPPPLVEKRFLLLDQPVPGVSDPPDPLSPPDPSDLSGPPAPADSPDPSGPARPTRLFRPLRLAGPLRPTGLSGPAGLTRPASLTRPLGLLSPSGPLRTRSPGGLVRVGQ